MAENKGFDGASFHHALKTVVDDRELNWKEVADETGVSASTLTRMAQGRKPDAASLAVLSAWAGLNPSDFVEAKYRSRPDNALGQISTLLRTDPSLDEDAAHAIESIVKAAYKQMSTRKAGK